MEKIDFHLFSLRFSFVAISWSVLIKQSTIAPFRADCILCGFAVSAVVQVKGSRNQVYALFATVSFFRSDCPPILWLAA